MGRYWEDETERVGFEPTVQLPVLRFSRPAHSTTLAPLQLANCMKSAGERTVVGRGRRVRSTCRKEAWAEAEIRRMPSAFRPAFATQGGLAAHPAAAAAAARRAAAAA